MTRITSYNVFSTIRNNFDPDDHEKSYTNLMEERLVRKVYINPKGFTAIHTRTGESEKAVECRIAKLIKLVA